MRATTLFIFALAFTLTAGIARSQSATPIVVQAVSAAPKPAAVVVAPPVVDLHSAEGAIKLLEQIKAANSEILAKQKAALERLDELQEAAEQLKIFAKRG
jgi:hypothetical protein